MTTTDTDLAALWHELGDVTEARTASRGGTDFSRYADDIIGFARDVLHVTPWSQQIAILKGIQDNARFVHVGANATGKTWSDAAAILWLIYARGMLVVATSALESQLKNQLMRDVTRLWHGADALGGELRSLGLIIPEHPDRGLICLAAGDAHRLRGYHSPSGLAVFLGEASGLPDWTFESAAMMSTSANDKVVASGNSDCGPVGSFWRAATTWPHVNVSALDHPNIVERRMVIPGGPSVESVKQMRDDYGETSPFFIAAVLGAWPTEVSDSLFSLAALENAFTLHANGTHHATMSRGKIVFGCDIARLGGDRTVVATLEGSVVTAFHAWGGVPLDETVDRIIEVVARHGVRPTVPINYGAEVALYHASADQFLSGQPGDPLERQDHARKARIRVDTIGVGGGVADSLRRLRYPVEDFNSSSAPTGLHAERFLNRRAQSYWRLRTLLEAGQLALPPEWRDQLVAELLATTYAKGGEDLKKIQIAPKSLIKTHLGGKSPDFADALVMATCDDASVSFDTALDVAVMF